MPAKKVSSKKAPARARPKASSAPASAQALRSYGVKAGATSTPQPPAVVSTIVFGPFGSGCVASRVPKSCRT